VGKRWQVESVDSHYHHVRYPRIIPHISRIGSGVWYPVRVLLNVCKVERNGKEVYQSDSASFLFESSFMRRI